MSKKFDIKTTKEINENVFYIRPFGAFVAANVFGEVTGFLSPIIGSIAPDVSDMDVKSLLDIDAEKLAPSIAKGLNGLITGYKVEEILKKLLVNYKNISVEVDGKEVQHLTLDLADELFCGELQDMFILAIEVIKANYNGFFRNLGDLFGKLKEKLEAGQPSSEDTES